MTTTTMNLTHTDTDRLPLWRRINWHAEVDEYIVKASFCGLLVLTGILICSL